jgi:protein-L-isoaspartate(D-aspartate) O-methyltransferase
MARSSPPTLFDFLGEETANAEEKAAFHLRLRAHGIQDLGVLRTLELVPRALFVPHRFADLAQKDVALPIGCGQTISAPSLVARVMEAFELAKHHSVLEVGSGSGYTAAILAQLAGEVMSIERFQSLATEARTRLGQMGIDNVEVVWADGLALPRQIGVFDRIFVDGRLDETPDRFIDLLAEDGILIVARDDRQHPARQEMVKISKRGGELQESLIINCRMQSLLHGLALAL